MNKSSKKTKQRYSYYSRTQEKLMSNLYQEAIADARALREMAERNAKNKIIEAITPKIRNMIERQIMMEAEGEAEEEVPNLDLDALPDDSAMDPMMPSPTMPSPVQGSATPDPDEEVTHTVTTKTASGTEVKINVRVDKHGEASTSAESEEAPGDDVEERCLFLLAVVGLPFAGDGDAEADGGFAVGDEPEFWVAGDVAGDGGAHYMSPLVGL